METQRSRQNVLVIIGVSLLLGVCFDYFFSEKALGINFPLYVAFVLAGLLIIAARFKKGIDKRVIWLAVPLAFFSLMIFVRSSLLLTFLNGIASVLLLLLIAEATVGREMRNYVVFDYANILLLPFKFVRPFFQTISGMATLKNTGKNTKVLAQVLRGIVVAVPVLVVFSLLFSSADIIFQKYLTNLININIQPETLLRLILVLLVTSIFIGAYSYIFRIPQAPAVQQKTNSTYTVGHIETSILLGSVNALFFIFILVQIAYLFGGESTISSQGFTYAEYARKGFFELIAVATISFFLLWATEKYTARKETKHNRLFSILGSALIIQVIVIMGSAFKRLLLYEEAFGFTILRLFSHAFIILLAFIFLLLLYKIFIDRKESTFTFYSFIAVAVFLVVMNVLNPDAFIAQRNINRFATTGELDVYYLSKLSDDAVPETIKVLALSNEDLRKTFARELYWRMQRASESVYLDNWQSTHISRLKAEGIFKLNRAELEKNKDYLQRNPESGDDITKSISSTGP